MRNAHWINKATKTRLEYVMLIAFEQKKWFCESFSILRSYIHILSCSPRQSDRYVELTTHVSCKGKERGGFAYMSLYESKIQTYKMV